MALVQNLQRVTQRAFSIDPLSEALDEHFTNDLVIGAHDEYARMGYTESRLVRADRLVQNPQGADGRCLDVGDKRVGDLTSLCERLL